MSELTLAYLKALIEWIDKGCPRATGVPFQRYYDELACAHSYMLARGEEGWVEKYRAIQKEITEILALVGIEGRYPFNKDMLDFNQELYGDALWTNTKRVDTMKQMYEWGLENPL